MGLFNRLKHKKKNIEQEIELEDAYFKRMEGMTLEELSFQMEKGNPQVATTEDHKRNIKENCEQIIETSRQLEDAKIEYQAVTSYLTDMQKIDQIDIEEREELEEAARNIITLSRERAKYQNRDSKLTDVQFKNLEKFENQIPVEIRNISEKENYQMIVKNDMRHLEGEKGALHFEKEDIIQKQTYLKGIATIMSILVMVLFLLFIAIAYVFEINMTLPFILTIAMAAGCVLYILIEARKNQVQMVQVERKLNRAIELLNKVKIKFINNKSSLDYSYNKFMINSSKELQYLWEQYVKVKEADERYKQNTDLLNHFNEILIDELRRFHITDPEIWLYQSVALLDKKEMVEIRHRLNVRRQKLRERIDYNVNLKDTAIQDIKQIITKNPGMKSDVARVLAEFGINL